MVLQIRRIILLLFIFCLFYQALYSQSYSSKNNYKGAWETPSSWNPVWPVPQTNISGHTVTINGYITLNSSLVFSGASGDLIINDTLVIKGDLSINDKNTLKVNDNGILIVRGNLIINKHADVIANGYLIVTGNIVKSGPNGEGSFTSNQDPVKVFVGGTIPSGLTNDNHKFPALNCTHHPTAPYPKSTCSYGNMADLMNDPIYPFFLSTCSTATPTISAGGTTTFCSGGSVTLTSGAGSAYLWSNGATTQSIVVTVSGSYSVRVTNSTGCQSLASIATIVTVNSLPVTPVITAAGPTTFCLGGSVVLTSSSGTSYLWSDGSTARSINVVASRNYTVKVTDSKGCQSASSTPVTVTVNVLPVVYAGSDLTIPTGTSTALNATVTGTGPFTYNWSPSSKLINPLSEDPTTVNLTSSAIFTLTATSVTTSCSSSDAVTVTTTGGALYSNPIAIPSSICSGANVQLFAQASGGSGSYSYTWTSVPAGFTSSLPNPTANPVVTTTYNVVVFDGFSTVNVQTIVTVNTSPGTPTITANGPTTFCSGGNVNLTSGAGNSYLWSTGETTSGITVSETGNYTVRVTNAAGCQSIPSTATMVMVNQFPVTPVITTGGTTTFCAGGNVKLTSSTGSSYLWSNGTTTQDVNITSSGGYSIQVTSAEGCQSASSDITIVTVNDLPLTPTITADGLTSFCDGDSINLTTSFGTGYLWSDGATSQSINVANSGSYSVQTSDINGCMSNSSPIVKVTVNPIPQVNISSSSSSLCVSDQRNLTGNPSGGIFTILSGPGTINGNILSATGPGTINLEYFYDNGCSNKAAQYIIADNNVVADAGPDQKLLYVFETQMTAVFSQYGTGEWSLVSGSGDINDIQSPTTRITGLSIGENKFLWKVHNGGCESTDEIVIDVSDIVTPTVITPNEDGLNDELIFTGMQAFPGSSIMIYNRWGNEVYRNSDYRNDWKGKDNNKRDLQPDTYYYVLKISNGRILKGFIEIRR